MGRETCGVELQRNNMGSSGEEEGAATSQLHVLAVDDSIADRKIIERLLNVSAFKVTTVESATRALEFLGLDEEHGPVNTDRQRIKVNMIITDYSMPGMTGYELLKKIKESSTLKETPVVIMSSENILTRIYRCLEEGAEEFIVKPVKLSDVNRLKCHIVKGLSKEHQNPTSAKRKRISDNLANLPEQTLERRPRLEEQAVF